MYEFHREGRVGCDQFSLFTEDGAELALSFRYGENQEQAPVPFYVFANLMDGDYWLVKNGELRKVSVFRGRELDVEIKVGGKVLSTMTGLGFIPQTVLDRLA